MWPKRRRLIFCQGFFIALLLAIFSFCCYLTFLYAHDYSASREVKQETTEANVTDGLHYSVPTVVEKEAKVVEKEASVVEKEATDVTKKTESDLSPGDSMTWIIGRQPQRLQLDESLRLDKIHIVIRTSVKFHHSRLELILLTWLQTAHPDNVSG